eukprot:scaffold2973_cov325-Prasinococcus_capsulatus_cf.AAC.9
MALPSWRARAAPGRWQAAAWRSASLGRAVLAVREHHGSDLEAAAAGVQGAVDLLLGLAQVVELAQLAVVRHESAEVLVRGRLAPMSARERLGALLRLAVHLVDRTRQPARARAAAAALSATTNTSSSSVRSRTRSGRHAAPHAKGGASLRQTRTRTSPRAGPGRPGRAGRPAGARRRRTGRARPPPARSGGR